MYGVVSGVTAGDGVFGLPLRRFGHGAGHGFFRFHWFGYHSLWHGGLFTILVLVVVVAAVVVGVRQLLRRRR